MGGYWGFWHRRDKNLTRKTYFLNDTTAKRLYRKDTFVINFWLCLFLCELSFHTDIFTKKKAVRKWEDLLHCNYLCLCMCVHSGWVHSASKTHSRGDISFIGDQDLCVKQQPVSDSLDWCHHQTNISDSNFRIHLNVSSLRLCFSLSANSTWLMQFWTGPSTKPFRLAAAAVCGRDTTHTFHLGVQWG